MKQILVIGDVILDHYILGDSTRISPEAPVPVINVAQEDIRPGGAANVAANIAAMGSNVTLMFLGGNDLATTQLIDYLSIYPLKLEKILDADFITTRKTRIVAASQQIVRIDRDFIPSSLQQQKLFECYKKNISNFDIIVFSDYAKGALDRLPEYIDLAKKHNKITLVDPKRNDPSFYQGATILKPNNREFNLLFGNKVPSPEHVSTHKSLLKQHSIESLIITRGDKGMLIIEKDKAPVELPTFAREVFDVSGAGDTVLAALSVSLTNQESLLEAAIFANVAAGIAVSHRGTYIVSSFDIERELMRNGSGTPKFISDQQLPLVIEKIRQENKKIVFTNGCFDILHPGHVRLLKEARSLGDVMIVGLNSDASVSALKGPARPLNTSQDRAEILTSLSSVDYVIEFDALTPYDLIKKITPDVLVKGGDYNVEDIVGYDIVKAKGGRIYSLKFHEGHSTTKIINDISHIK